VVVQVATLTLAEVLFREAGEDSCNIPLADAVRRRIQQMELEHSEVEQ